ncbi:mannitol dehydrogenase family protein [Brevibacterium sp.]|uniref:mannitol dehydrogenase family protein n=1 Tax=Brevibacterium sp. TaxID=1701 RepID=UPI00264A174F|nr:mannitol dehydrogenase family protein [Brevibacterium sp.]MDN6133301.1 mannitol dehydrogenase family protein [Brevibacterium sp.]MDN6191484.1 mannitol dehydrogenase family protein [Brevibacterium sp.]MDN6602954.1 mannitol dehydrogenase family protein [Brevibacterium sp.]
MLSLHGSNLDRIAARGVRVPGYDRSTVTPGIVHFGVGGFHRAHMAVVLDDLMAAGRAAEWGIVGAGVLPHDVRMRDALAGQDHLYSLTLKHPDGTRQRRVIGSIIDYRYGPDDPQGLVDLLGEERIRIVSLTVTEGGYNVNPVTGEFIADDAMIAADAAALAARQLPRTVFGYVIEALRRRRDAGVAPFTVQSCDNISENGNVAKKMFGAFAGLVDPELAAWIDAHVAFPNAMVDRITPATTDEDRAELSEETGLEDAWPVVAEPFFQWVLEDSFTSGRPPYESAGAQVVDDVRPYEHMKLRLLNSGHQGLAYFGLLAGYTYAHEAMENPDIAAYLRRYMDEEGTPSLEPLPGIDLDGYKDSLIERFSNPEIRDTLARLGAESSDRIPKWLVPVIIDNLASGAPVEVAAAICASWARYAEGSDEQGAAFTIVDRFAEELQRVAKAQSADPLAFVRQGQFFGPVANDSHFAGPYLAALRSLHERGAKETVRRIAVHEKL